MSNKKNTDKPADQTTDGTNDLREVHGDWVVLGATRTKDDKTEKACVIVQEQLHNNENDSTKQRLLRVELSPNGSGGIQGVLVLPFGLLLARGVIVQVDGGLQSPPLAFRTAAPIGCLVDLRADAENAAQMKAGKQLQLHAATADNGSNVTFVVSLNGFADALARAETFVAS
jgi:invasion protein IalB